jgi:hypothetical protein
MESRREGVAGPLLQLQEVIQMRRVILSMIALSLASGSAALNAQTPEREHRHARGSMAGPVARILAQRDELGLSAQQVNRIEQIQATLEANNGPLVAQLRSTLGDSMSLAGERRGDPAMRERMRERASHMTPEERAELRERLEERRGEPTPRLSAEQREAIRPLMEQMRENRVQALREVQEVLTPEQQSRLRELREGRGARERHHGAERRGSSPRG